MRRRDLSRSTRGRRHDLLRLDDLDRAYDHDIYRDQVRQRRIAPAIARRAASMAPDGANTAGSSNAASSGCGSA
ncbi:hypothetical protein ASD97_11465 [Streptomyces sp. Root63]|nr:hypothetical protein ASD29_16645 [Streptomyces sp. Root1295]KRA40412.1 hypothetical protein ASD97_11465 [Streptomyces sp. Root63]